MKPPGSSGCPVAIAVSSYQRKIFVDGELYPKDLPRCHTPSLQVPNQSSVSNPSLLSLSALTEDGFENPQEINVFDEDDFTFDWAV
jgi:hypothetical protein